MSTYARLRKYYEQRRAALARPCRLRTCLAAPGFPCRNPRGVIVPYFHDSRMTQRNRPYRQRSTDMPQACRHDCQPSCDKCCENGCARCGSPGHPAWAHVGDARTGMEIIDWNWRRLLGS